MLSSSCYGLVGQMDIRLWVSILQREPLAGSAVVSHFMASQCNSILFHTLCYTCGKIAVFIFHDFSKDTSQFFFYGLDYKESKSVAWKLNTSFLTLFCF